MNPPDPRSSTPTRLSPSRSRRTGGTGARFTGDVDKVVRALVSSLDAPPYPVQQKWSSPSLCVFEVLLSLDRRRAGSIDETLKRLQKPDPEYGSLDATRAYVEAFPSPKKFFLVDLRDPNAKRASLLLPLLNALIDAGRDFAGRTERDRLKVWAEAARPSDFSFGPFLGLGLKGFQLLRTRLGASTVIPTFEVTAFVARATGRKVDASEAVYLLERAAARLRYDLRGIPTETWTRGLPGRRRKGA